MVPLNQMVDNVVFTANPAASKTANVVGIKKCPKCFYGNSIPNFGPGKTCFVCGTNLDHEKLFDGVKPAGAVDFQTAMKNNEMK